MGSRSGLGGMEVPITGSDSLKWVEIPAPAADISSTTTCVIPLTHDIASSVAIGDPSSRIHLIRRVHNDLPHHLELFELSITKDFPKVGLRITFPDALSPLVPICIDMGSMSHPYLVYALTVSGVAYLFRLGPISTYASCSVFQEDEVVMLNMNPSVPVTSAAGTSSGCLVIGRDDGSLACFQLGKLDPTAPGFALELQDDLGFRHLWGFMSRGRRIGPVQDLVICIFHGKPLVFVLHSDGMLRVWDLSCHSRIFSKNMNSSSLAEATLERLWIGEVGRHSNMIPLAILYRQTSAGWVDVKLTSNKICISSNNGLMLHNLLTNGRAEDACSYALQDFVADQLFQSSEHSSDDLLLMTHSVFSSSMDHIVPVVSSIFFRRLLLPGVHHNIALRSTLLDYNRHWSDSDFQSLSYVVSISGQVTSQEIWYMESNFMPCTRNLVHGVEF